MSEVKRLLTAAGCLFLGAVETAAANGSGLIPSDRDFRRSEVLGDSR
jgi:hypothetical protein